VIRQVLDNQHHRLLDAGLVRVDVDLRGLWGLVRRRDTGEVLDYACARLLVQALGVALLGNLDGDVDVHLDEGDWLVACGNGGVQVAGDLAVGLVGRDERCESRRRGVGEELCYL
jgi:hypothetical protein